MGLGGTFWRIDFCARFHASNTFAVCIDHLVALGAVQIAFMILVECFFQRPSYLLKIFPPTQMLLSLLSTFDTTVIDAFGHLIGPGALGVVGWGLVLAR